MITYKKHASPERAYQERWHKNFHLIDLPNTPEAVSIVREVISAVQEYNPNRLVFVTPDMFTELEERLWDAGFKASDSSLQLKGRLEQFRVIRGA